MPLLLWSGGCDSTYLLLQLLKQQKDAEEKARQPTQEGDKPYEVPPNAHVRTLTIVHPNVGAKQEQRNARNRAIQKLNKLGYTWPHLEITIDHQNHHTGYEANGAGENGGIVQPLIWIPVAILYLHHHEDLAIGYIKGDDAQFYITTLRNAFDNLQWVAGRAGKLVTPIDNVSKPEIIHWLKEEHLYKHTWHCEDPQYAKKPEPKKLELGPHNLHIDAQEHRQTQEQNGRPCKKCAPCMAHATALWQLQSGNCPIAKTLKLGSKRIAKPIKNLRANLKDIVLPAHNTQPLK